MVVSYVQGFVQKRGEYPGLAEGARRAGGRGVGR